MTEQESKKHGNQHRELRVQMEINRSNATAGGSGASVAASAIMSVLVTLNGEPVDDLGANAGTGTSAVNLPTGWVLSNGFNMRPRGCGVSVTEFVNQGGGLYDIRIGYSSATPPARGCRESTSTPSSSISRAPSTERPSCFKAEHWASSRSRRAGARLQPTPGALPLLIE